MAVRKITESDNLVNEAWFNPSQASSELSDIITTISKLASDADQSGDTNRAKALYAVLRSAKSAKSTMTESTHLVESVVSEVLSDYINDLVDRIDDHEDAIEILQDFGAVADGKHDPVDSMSDENKAKAIKSLKSLL